MSGPKPSWEQLARAAQPTAARAKPGPSTDWTAAVAAKAMAGASLGRPSPWTVVAAWATLPKIVLPLLALLLAGGMWLGPRFLGGGTSAEQRSSLWAEATLRQLKAWHPMECEEAGAIGQLLQRRASELTTTTNAAAVLDSTQAEIGRLLTPPERAAFESEQARLRAKWFPAPGRKTP